MSLPADCPACVTGDHSRHNRDWNITPGLIGGSYCPCTGSCAERAQAAYEEFAEKWKGALPHSCPLPDLATWDHDEDFTCPDCGKDWFVSPKNFCHSCYRHDGPEWTPYGTGDGSFPRISVDRGPISYDT